MLPGLREEVAAVFVHLGDGRFFPFVPVGREAGASTRPFLTST